MLAELERQGIKPGLDATRRLLGELGRPHEGLPVVLVAGTNGKGSTAALLAAIAVAAGYRVGLFTSPHLEEPRERLRLDGRSIELAALESSIRRVVEAGRQLGRVPTYFEAMTAAALLWFRRSAVDLAILEVGLGGRLDATNVTEPRLSIVTSIAHDHTEFLGDTLAQIATEKAGILRRGRPAVSGVRGAEAVAAIRAATQRLGARLIEVRPPDFTLAEGEGGIELRTPTAAHVLRPSLAGRHQAENVQLAVAAAEELARDGFDRLDRRAIAAGVERCRWPARLERVALPDGREILLDAAHNAEAVTRLLAHLRAGGTPFVVLFGALADKAVGEMLEPLHRAALRTVVTRADGPRAWWPTGREAASLRAAGVELVEDRGAALDRVLDVAERIVVCGSIFLVGPIRRRLRDRYPQTVRAAAEVDVAGGDA